MQKTFALLLTLCAWVSIATAAHSTVPKPVAAHAVKSTKKTTASAMKAPRLDCSICYAEGYKCINNVCEFGYKFYTHYMAHSPYYICFYKYVWSDGSISPEYWEHSPTPCH